jgi:hypothetical protein
MWQFCRRGESDVNAAEIQANLPEPKSSIFIVAWLKDDGAR